MKRIILCLSAFILIYLVYLLTVILRKKKLEKFKKNTYVRYLENIYHIDVNKVGIKKLANVISITNAFIISLTLYIVLITNSLIMEFLLAIAVFIPLQLLFYHIIGKYFGRRN